MAGFDDRMRRRARIAAIAKIAFAIFALFSMVGLGTMRACRSLDRPRGAAHE